MHEAGFTAAGVARALEFLRRVREDPALAAQAEQIVADDGLGPVLTLAARTGLRFSAEDLRRAYRVDWHLRRARYA
jgi:hypothetical protein